MKFGLFLALLLTLAGTPCNAVPADWTTPVTPFRTDNLYFVGSRDLAAYFIVTPEGNIFINANLESSPAQIRGSVEHLGFRWTDTQILLSSQAHFDHAAGAAEVLQETHAQYMVMDGDVDFAMSSDLGCKTIEQFSNSTCILVGEAIVAFASRFSTGVFHSVYPVARERAP
jgi:metallo-beta-lactamase class B